MKGDSVLHPRIRLPLWAAAAIVLAALVWHVAFQGWRSLGPLDFALLGVFVGLLLVVWVIRRWGEESDDETGDG